MQELEPRPLPGAQFLAHKIERRRFLRKSANAIFYGMVATAGGAVGLSTFLADPAAAAGACCPSCCGPSACCNSSCCNKPCCSYGTSTTCANNGSTCLGVDANTWPGSTPNNCWSCTDAQACRTTICCDCKTNNRTGCPNPNGHNRCICWRSINACFAADLKALNVPARRRDRELVGS